MEYTSAKKYVFGIAVILLIVSLSQVLASGIGEKGIEIRGEGGFRLGKKIGGSAGVCVAAKCKDFKVGECEKQCTAAGYRAGICLPPAKNCCCVY